MTKAKKKATTTKVVKKKTAKKTKKASPINAKLTQKADKNVYFIRVDGQHICSLPDLVHQLHEMHDDIYYHHVTEMRNDFAQWIEDVFEDKALADMIRPLRDKQATGYVIMKRLVPRK